MVDRHIQRKTARLRVARRACAGFLLLGVAASAQAEVRITRVEVPGEATATVGLQGPYMKKFQTPDLAARERVVRIEWQTDEVVPAGTLVIFEYRTAKGRDKVWYKKIDRPSHGRQEVVLSFEEPSEIAAWRVRIAAGPRWLAVRTSANWR